MTFSAAVHESVHVTGFGCRPARQARDMLQGRGPAFESRQ